jgi:DNA-binding NarL/FixJ family response regulator
MVMSDRFVAMLHAGVADYHKKSISAGELSSAIERLLTWYGLIEDELSRKYK